MSDEIWLGDLARAFAALTPRDERERQRIAATLGLVVPAAPGIEAGASGTKTNAKEPGTDRSPHPQLDTPPALPDTPTATPRDKRDAAGRRSPAGLPLLTPVGQEPPPVFAWHARTLPRVDLARLRAPLPHDPLLAPRSMRAILHTLFAQEVPDGPVDTAAVIEALARRRPQPVLPRKRQRTLRFGAQLLVDRGVGMQPFARDQADLIERVRALLGPEYSEVQYFVGSPLRGVSLGSAKRRTPYRPPATGTRVLLLSDFGVTNHGLGPRALQPEWQHFLAMLHRQECYPVALVPYPQDRSPRWLNALLTLITWDRSTTAGRVQARMR